MSSQKKSGKQRQKRRKRWFWQEGTTEKEDIEGRASSLLSDEVSAPFLLMYAASFSGDDCGALLYIYNTHRETRLYAKARESLRSFGFIEFWDRSREAARTDM